MRIEYDWRGLTETEFENYKKAKPMADTFIGCCRVGDVCFDLVTRELEFNQMTLTYDVYVGGEDTGYGYSARKAIEGNPAKFKTKYDVPDELLYPYDEADGGCFTNSCIEYSYEDFRTMAEKEFTKFLEESDYPNIRIKAEMPLHIW